MDGLNVSGPHVRGDVHAAEGDASGGELNEWGGLGGSGLGFAGGFGSGGASCKGERGEKSRDEDLHNLHSSCLRNVDAFYWMRDKSVSSFEFQVSKPIRYGERKVVG